MNVAQVITHAPTQGVSLRKAGDPVIMTPLPARVIYRPCVSMSGVPLWERVWASPRSSISAWVSALLAEGEYEDASHLSGYLHAPVPHLPENVIIYFTN